jgi:adenine phosphoribosyltransferase
VSEPASSISVPLGLGVTAELPLHWVDEHTGLYSFVLLGQVDWVRACATSLMEAVDDALDGEGVDIIVTPEAKAITLAYELCVRMSLEEFVVARKSRKLYMVDPVHVPVNSITTATEQELWFGQGALSRLRGKRIMIVDDVISTGATMQALFDFLHSIDCTIAVVACALTEGEERDSFEGVPLISIGHIPLAHR